MKREIRLSKESLGGALLLVLLELLLLLLLLLLLVLREALLVWKDGDAE